MERAVIRTGGNTATREAERRAGGTRAEDGVAVVRGRSTFDLTRILCQDPRRDGVSNHRLQIGSASRSILFSVPLINNHSIFFFFSPSLFSLSSFIKYNTHYGRDYCRW